MVTLKIRSEMHEFEFLYQGNIVFLIDLFLLLKILVVMFV